MTREELEECKIDLDNLHTRVLQGLCSGSITSITEVMTLYIIDGFDFDKDSVIIEVLYKLLVDCVADVYLKKHRRKKPGYLQSTDTKQLLDVLSEGIREHGILKDRLQKQLSYKTMLPEAQYQMKRLATFNLRDTIRRDVQDDALLFFYCLNEDF